MARVEPSISLLPPLSRSANVFQVTSNNLSKRCAKSTAAHENFLKIFLRCGATNSRAIARATSMLRAFSRCVRDAICFVLFLNSRAQNERIRAVRATSAVDYRCRLCDCKSRVRASIDEKRRKLDRRSSNLSYIASSSQNWSQNLLCAQKTLGRSLGLPGVVPIQITATCKRSIDLTMMTERMFVVGDGK